MPSRITINTNSLNVPWTLGTQIRIALDADFVKEASNNRKGNPAVNNLVTFTTNATAPTLSSSAPANDSFDQENNTSITLTFNRNVEAGAGTIQLYQADAGVDTLLYTYNMGDPAFVTFSTNIVTLKTTGLLRADSAYYVDIDIDAVRDIDNFNYAGSRTAKTITANGNVQTNSAVIKWSNVDSFLFDGVGDYLSVTSSADFGYGTGAFIIETWIRPTTASQTSVIVDHRPTATEGVYPTLRLQAGVLQYFVDSAVRITGTTITVNDWSFVQVARFAGVTRLYVNGAQVGSDYTDSNNYPTAAVKIGINGVDLSAGFVGYMSDIRILKAPSGLQGMPTRSRTNDAFTVLYVQGAVSDVNSVIFFDTQEEALGFPSLSANLTGAFAPTFTVRYTAAGQIVMASSINIVAAVRKIVQGQLNFAMVVNMVTQPAITRTITSTMNTSFTHSTLAVATKRAQSNFTDEFVMGFPRVNVGSMASAVTNQFVTQVTLDAIPNQNNSVFVTNDNTFNAYSPYEIRCRPTQFTHTPGVNSGVVEIYTEGYSRQNGVNGVLTFNSFNSGQIASATAGFYNNVALSGGTGTGLTVRVAVNESLIITHLQITNTGTNYSLSDTLSIPAGALGAGSAVVSGITVATRSTNATFNNVARALLSTINNPVESPNTDPNYENFGARHMVVQQSTLLIMQQSIVYECSLATQTVIREFASPSASGSGLAQCRGHVFGNRAAVIFAGRAAVYNRTSGALLYTLVDPDRNVIGTFGDNQTLEVRVNDDYCLFYNNAGTFGSPTKQSASVFALSTGTFLQGFEQTACANLGISNTGNEVLVNNVLYVLPPFTLR